MNNTHLINKLFAVLTLTAFSCGLFAAPSWASAAITPKIELTVTQTANDVVHIRAVNTTTGTYKHLHFSIVYPDSSTSTKIIAMGTPAEFDVETRIPNALLDQDVPIDVTVEAFNIVNHVINGAGDHERILIRKKSDKWLNAADVNLPASQVATPTTTTPPRPPAAPVTTSPEGQSVTAPPSPLHPLPRIRFVSPASSPGGDVTAPIRFVAQDTAREFFGQDGYYTHLEVKIKKGEQVILQRDFPKGTACDFMWDHPATSFHWNLIATVTPRGTSNPGAEESCGDRLNLWVDKSPAHMPRLKFTAPTGRGPGQDFFRSPVHFAAVDTANEQYSYLQFTLKSGDHVYYAHNYPRGTVAEYTWDPPGDHFSGRVEAIFRPHGTVGNDLDEQEATLHGTFPVEELPGSLPQIHFSSPANDNVRPVSHVQGVVESPVHFAAFDWANGQYTDIKISITFRGQTVTRTFPKGTPAEWDWEPPYPSFNETVQAVARPLGTAGTEVDQMKATAILELTVHKYPHHGQGAEVPEVLTNGTMATENTPARSASVDNQTPGVAERDSTPPTVSFLAPADGDTVHGTVRVRVSARDNAEMQKVEIKPGTGAPVVLTESPYDTEWDVSGLADGNQSLTATAWDISGNQAQARIMVRVDNPAKTAPSEAADLPESAGMIDEGAGQPHSKGHPSK